MIRKLDARQLMLPTTAIALLLAAAATQSPAQASTAYDRSFQRNGTLLLPKLRGIYGQTVRACSVAGSRLHVAGDFGPFAPIQSLATTSISLIPRQKTKSGTAAVRWTKQRIPSGNLVVGSDFDPRGGFAYATRAYSGSRASRLTLFRIDASGRRVKGFGRNGYVTVALTLSTTHNPNYVRVIALKDGGVFLLSQNNAGQTIRRFTRSGGLDPHWGVKGEVRLPAPTGFFDTPLSALDSAGDTTDGGLLIAASGTPTVPQPGTLGLIKLTRTGALETSWAVNGFWTPPRNARALMTAMLDASTVAILTADPLELPEGVQSELNLSQIDAATGAQKAAEHAMGSYYNGGDNGFPSAQPWSLAASASGPVFAFASSYYGRPGGSFSGAITQVRSKAGSGVIRRSINNVGFATGAFAVDPARPVVYSCGSLGVTPARPFNPERSGQRKQVAIRRVRL